ncbi:MAG: cytochrome C biogenesis protein [Alphaproteobacteria bacterium]|nr:cytochrome C biogenesis protein [Alphaproteobacteria bacterium]
MADPVKTEHATAEIIAERSAVVPGDQFLGALKLDMIDGWHVYWKNAGDSGESPEIAWATADGVKTGAFSWPAPHAIPVATLMNYGYEHQVVLPFEVTVPADYKPGDKLELKGQARWLICSDVCVPEQAQLDTVLSVADTPASNEASSNLIAAALANVPKPATGDQKVKRAPTGFAVGVADPEMALAAKTATSIRFYPDGPEIENAAPQKGYYGADGVSIDMQASDLAAKGDAPLSGAIIIEAKDGGRHAWDVKATPGDLPAGVTGKTIGAGPALGGLALLGILGAAFLGGLVLNLMPCVLPVLSIKAAGLVHTAHDPKESRAHGVFYTAGVVICFLAIGAILVALRAAGEQAGLGFQLQYPPLVAVFALLMFAVGLNLLGVFEVGTSLMGMGGNLAEKEGASGAFFTGLLAAFVGAPCVGPFMAPAVGVALAQPALVVLLVFAVIGLGLAAPFLVLSFTPALARLLPKPGKWMSTFRQVLAFPMFLTAVWLLWILAAQAGSDGVILVVGGAIILSFGIWLATKIGGKLVGRGVAALIILAGFVTPAVLSAGTTAPAEAGTMTTAEADSQPWSPQLVADLQAQKKVIFVDFTARWCATCQVNKRLVLESSEVKKLFAEHNVAFLVADWTNRDGVIAEALAQYDRAGVPLYLVYPASGGPAEVLPQILSTGLVTKAVKEAAGTQTAQASAATPINR